MSYKHLNAAYEDSKAQGLTKFVLVYLAGAANEHGICWPSLSGIARKCGISERTVHRSIRDLVDLGELRVYEKGGPIAGKNVSNHYEVVGSHRPQGGDTVTPGVGSHRHPNHNIESPLNIEPPNPLKRGQVSFSLREALQIPVPDLDLANSAEFRTEWERWVTNRFSHPKGKPTLGAIEEHLRKCVSLGVSRSIPAIRHSIATGKMSIFEAPQFVNGKPTTSNYEIRSTIF